MTPTYLVFLPVCLLVILAKVSNHLTSPTHLQTSYLQAVGTQTKPRPFLGLCRYSDGLRLVVGEGHHHVLDTVPVGLGLHLADVELPVLDLLHDHQLQVDQISLLLPQRLKV